MRIIPVDSRHTRAVYYRRDRSTLARKRCGTNDCGRFFRRIRGIPFDLRYSAKGDRAARAGRDPRKQEPGCIHRDENIRNCMDPGQVPPRKSRTPCSHLAVQSATLFAPLQGNRTTRSPEIHPSHGAFFRSRYRFRGARPAARSDIGNRVSRTLRRAPLASASQAGLVIEKIPVAGTLLVERVQKPVRIQ